jgi:hypothetical protein
MGFYTVCLNYATRAVSALFGVEKFGATTLAAARAGGGKPGLSALADQCALEFGERREQVKGELPVNRAGVDPFGQRPEFDPAFLKSARQRDQVRHRAAEPVETPHDELIAAARHFQGQRQTRSRRLGAADPILIDPSAAGPGQRVALQIEILIVG